MAKTRKNPGPKWRRRSDERPDEVMDAALDLFMKNGFAATRVEDIARHAGVSKGTIYLYFDTKEAILEGLVRRAIVPIVERSEAMAQSMPGDPVMTIRMMISMVAQRVSDPRLFAIPRLILTEAGNFPEIAQTYRNEVIERGFRVLESLLKQGMEQGLFRPIEPRLAIRNIAGPVIAQALLANVFGAEEDVTIDPQQFVESHLNILFNGLLAAPEET